MPKYNYKCPSEDCGRDYSETRSTDHPQFYTKCTCETEYIFLNEEPA